MHPIDLAPVAKLDKALVYETRDYRFESCRVRQFRLRVSPPGRFPKFLGSFPRHVEGAGRERAFCGRMEGSG